MPHRHNAIAIARVLLEQLQAELNEDVPFVTVGALSDVIAWPDNVHGVIPGGQGTILLGSAWIQE